MGGGGAMRAAARIAGINAGLRGVSPAQHPISSATRKAANKPVDAIVSAKEESSWSGLSTNTPIDTVVQRPCWELDDWEIAGGEGDAGVVSGELLPRLVFGRIPTLEEAKEASNELKDVLNEIYLSSPNAVGYKEAGNESDLLLIEKKEYLENKVCVINETATNSLPTNALNAFRLFNESPAAQSVVASIASDTNVWHAVMQNEALSEFLYSQKTSAPLLDNSSVTEEYTANTDQNSKTGRPSDGNKFMGFLGGLKSSVVEMMDSLSEYFQKIFGDISSVKDIPGTDTSVGASFTEKAMGASFLGLAIMVIMIVVLKRP